MHQDVPTISTTTSHSSSTSDGKEHGISGAKTDEIFYPPNGTRKSSDEDLNICLSMYNLVRICMYLHDITFSLVPIII